MRILAIDNALGTCGVALIIDDKMIAEQSATLAQGWFGTVPALVRIMLSRDQIVDLIAVTVGPGSFTGIRASIALAYGLAAGWGSPVVGVGIIEAFTSRYSTVREQVWTAISSRPGRVLLAEGERISSHELNDLPPMAENAVLFGNAASAVARCLYVHQSLSLTVGAQTPRLDAVAAIGLARWKHNRPTLQVRPLYLDVPGTKRSHAQ